MRYSKPFNIDIGARSRLESFEEDTKLASGFFTPDQLWRHEGFLELRGEIGHRFQYDFRGAAGTQRILQSAPYRLSWEAASSLQFRLTNRVSLTLNYLRRNYSLLTRDGWYQGAYIGLQIEP